MHLIYKPDMTLVEICSGTAPGARAASILGINSISFDYRQNQNDNAASLLNEFHSKYDETPVSILLLLL